MPYSENNLPYWCKDKQKHIQKAAVAAFNKTFDKTGSESKARKDSIASMKVAEASTNKSKLIQKSLNEEKRLATFIVLEPQDTDGTTTDLHADWYDADTILDACIEFNKTMHLRKGNLYHATETDGYTFLESYILPADMQLGDRIVKAGSWLMTLSFSSLWQWEAVKNGTFNGVSVQCDGVIENITTD